MSTAPKDLLRYRRDVDFLTGLKGSSAVIYHGRTKRGANPDTFGARRTLLSGTNGEIVFTILQISGYRKLRK